VIAITEVKSSSRKDNNSDLEKIKAWKPSNMPVDDIYLSDDVTDELEDSSPDRVNDSYTMQATGRTKIELSRN
jgi:hypothetical protein